MATRRITRLLAGILAVLQCVLLCGCAAGDSGDVRDPRLVAILHLDTDSEDLILEGQRALETAGLESEFVAVADLPVADRPSWAADEEGGWLLFVLPDEKDAALAAYEAWMAELGARAAAIPPPPQALALGPAEELEAQRTQLIRDELARRVQADQEVRRSGKPGEDMAAVDSDNTQYLRALAREVGWIDALRFGREAAEAAFLLVQHSGDLPLMLAALPVIEQDVRAGHLDAQPYALLYDRLHFLQGGQQRYGSQIVVRDNGHQVVERLEDPDHVDDRRRELGLEPLADYLSRFEGVVTIER